MSILLARYALPPIPALSAPEKLGPNAVALPFGDAVLAVFGARMTPTTIIKWSGETAEHREYPYVAIDFSAVSKREAARDPEDFDPLSDVASANVADRPLAMVAADGRAWVVREYGHAEIDLATLDVRPVRRSQVKWLVPLDNGDVLAASGAQYSSINDFQRFVRVPARELDQPLIRTRTGLNGNSDWRTIGTTFPAGEAATAFTEGVHAITSRGSSHFHASSAVQHRDEVIVSGHEHHRSGTSGAALVAIDLASEKVVRVTPLTHDERLEVISTHGWLIGVGDKSIARIEPSTLALTETAALPTGFRIIGHDAQRLVVLHRRSKTVLVVASETLSGSLDAFAGALAEAAKPPKGKAKK